MTITYDPAKRQATLETRGLDFKDAALILQGETYRFEDIRFNYGEKRMICYGFLHNRLIALVYVQRGDTTHIISMRKANDREQKKFKRQE